jgi:hypothetical protein
LLPGRSCSANVDWESHHAREVRNRYLRFYSYKPEGTKDRIYLLPARLLVLVETTERLYPTPESVTPLIRQNSRTRWAGGQQRHSKPGWRKPCSGIWKIAHGGRPFSVAAIRLRGLGCGLDVRGILWMCLHAPRGRYYFGPSSWVI